MTKKWFYSVAALSLLLAYAVGRYQGNSSSQSIKKAEQINVRSTSTATADRISIDRSIVTRTDPDGAVTKTQKDITTHEKAETKAKVEERIVYREVEKKVKKASKADYRIGISVGLTTSSSRLHTADAINPILSLVPYNYGVQAERRLVGPVWAGVRVTSDKSLALTFSVEF